MARQVYFDPFGAYAGGYDKGAQTEQNLQTNLRNARDSDYSYYNFKPLELAQKQRDDELGRTAQPYVLQLPRIGLENARAEGYLKQIGAGQSAAQYGFINPTLQALSNLMGYRGYTEDAAGGTGQLVDTMGNPYGPQLGMAGVIQADPKIREENRLTGNDNFDRWYKTAATDINAYQADTQRGVGGATAAVGFGRNAIDEQAAAAEAAGGTMGLPRQWFKLGDPLRNVFTGQGPTVAGPQQVPMAAPATAPPAYLTPNLPAGYNPNAAPAAPAPAPVGTQAVPVRPFTSAEDMVQWMRAANPSAPALTAAELSAMEPTARQAYFQTYYPRAYQSPAPTTPAVIQ